MLSGIKVTNLKSAHRAVQAISCKGIENVVITLGKEGAFVKEKDKYIMIPAKEVDTIDTTGAGDVFRSFECLFIRRPFFNRGRRIRKRSGSNCRNTYRSTKCHPLPNRN